MPTARPSLSRLLPLLILGILAFSATGCVFGTSPSTVNIELRKEKQSLAGKVAEMEKQVAAQDQVIQGLREKWPTIATLPQDRLDRLFTTHGLQLGRLTGGWDKDRSTPGDEGIIVYVNPADDSGQPIKMAGNFTIEAFDLANSSTEPVGKWIFDVDASRKAWRGSFMDYNYVLECPWQEQRPKHEELTLKITFLDELTQIPFRAQQVIKIKLGATTQPATTQTTSN